MLSAWRLFNDHRSDGGGTYTDAVLNSIGMVLMLGTLAGAFYLWSRKSDPAVGKRDPDLTLVQTVAGFVWWAAAIVKFNGVWRMDRPALQACNTINFFFCNGLGFGVWAACIGFRLLRLHTIYVRKADRVRIGSTIKLFVRQDKWKLVALIWAPMGFMWCIVLPLFGASELITLGRASNERSYITCIYSSAFWTYLDVILILAVFFALIMAAHSMENIDDALGENKAMKNSLDFAVGALLIILVVEIFQLDGIWLGRAIVSFSLAASITLFFVALNGARCSFPHPPPQPAHTYARAPARTRAAPRPSVYRSPRLSRHLPSLPPPAQRPSCGVYALPRSTPCSSAARSTWSAPHPARSSKVAARVQGAARQSPTVRLGNPSVKWTPGARA